MRRSNEDFAAAVYCRSEATIQANKKRRQALLTALPLAVCLLGASVAVFPGLLRENTVSPVSTPTDDLPTADTYGGSVSIVAPGAAAEEKHQDLTGGMLNGDGDDAVISTSTQSVEVQRADGDSRLCTDPVVIARLEGLLPAEAVEAARRGSASKGDDADAANKHTPPLYRFVLTDEDGTRYLYTLSEKRLYVDNVDRSFALSAQETAALLQTLQSVLVDK